MGWSGRLGAGGNAFTGGQVRPRPIVTERLACLRPTGEIQEQHADLPQNRLHKA